ncbi:MAG: hypothetical protein ACKVJU_05625 [Verrucomicrobiales bacterium]
MSGRYATPATEFSDQFGFSDNLGWIVTMLRPPTSPSARGFVGAWNDAVPWCAPSLRGTAKT